MLMTHLYPPGRVMWATRRADIEHAQPPPVGAPRYRVPHGAGEDPPGALRLFEVLDVERVFGQIVFSRDMLRCVSPPFSLFRQRALPNTSEQRASAARV
jgi:sn1-specific diacylglycerol lipase